MNNTFNLGIIATVLAAFAFTSCSKDDNEDVKPLPEPEPEPIVYSEVGVWESGNYFIALSSDHTISAYVAPNFIDGGTYSISDDKVITCKNAFYVRTTTYTIESIDDKKMKVKIKYVANDGTEKVTTLDLTKSDKDAPSQYNPLVGKGFSILSGVFGTITYSFESNCLGTKTCTKSDASKYPLRMFYITLEDRCYFLCYNQGNWAPLIGAWNDASMEDLNVYKLVFGNGGAIIDAEKVSKDYL